MKIGVVGAGGWGTAQAKLLVENGHQVILWAYEPETVQEINELQYNQRFLPGVNLPEDLVASQDPEEVVSGAELIVFVVPSQWLRSTAKLFADLLSPNVIIVNASKGSDHQSLNLLSQVLKERIGRPRISSWSSFRGLIILRK